MSEEYDSENGQDNRVVLNMFPSINEPEAPSNRPMKVGNNTIVIDRNTSMMTYDRRKKNFATIQTNLDEGDDMEQMGFNKVRKTSAILPDIYQKKKIVGWGGELCSPPSEAD